jgi:tRNA-dihydrouridine synthase C
LGSALGRIVLAPMEGLADDVLRAVLTQAGGYDWCVTEFVRVTTTLLPHSLYTRTSPELKNGSRTASGTPVRIQLLGSDPDLLAANAAHLALLQPCRHRPQLRLPDAAGQSQPRRRRTARRA